MLFLLPWVFGRDVEGRSTRQRVFCSDWVLVCPLFIRFAQPIKHKPMTPVGTATAKPKRNATPPKLTDECAYLGLRADHKQQTAPRALRTPIKEKRMPRMKTRVFMSSFFAYKPERVATLPFYTTKRKPDR